MKTKQTKIVATIGPSSSSKEVLAELINSGMNVARLNFSHGNYQTKSEIISRIRELNQELGTHVAILADLQGPKIRVGDMGEGVLLKNSESFELTNGRGSGLCL